MFRQFRPLSGILNFINDIPYLKIIVSYPSVMPQLKDGWIWCGSLMMHLKISNILVTNFSYLFLIEEEACETCLKLAAAAKT